MNGGALSSGGTDNNGGSDTTGTGGSAGNSSASGASGQASSGQGGSGGAAGTGGGGSVIGGAGGVAGSAMGGTSAGGGSAGASNLDLIDDLEDDNKTIILVNSPKRDGIWDTGNDGSAGGTQIPAPGTFKPTALGTDVPYAGDLFAAYSKGSGFTNYGAFMNVSMRTAAIYKDTPTYDASAYKGLSFWAKVGSASTKNLRVRFISSDTDPRGNVCKDPAAMPTPPQGQFCYNHYYASVVLSKTWTLYTLPFTPDTFSEGADGMSFPTINLKGMFGLEFYFAVADDYEVWIDDLSFVKK